MSISHTSPLRLGQFSTSHLFSSYCYNYTFQLPALTLFENADERYFALYIGFSEPMPHSIIMLYYVSICSPSSSQRQIFPGLATLEYLVLYRRDDYSSRYFYDIYIFRLLSCQVTLSNSRFISWPLSSIYGGVDDDYTFQLPLLEIASLFNYRRIRWRRNFPYWCDFKHRFNYLLFHMSSSYYFASSIQVFASLSHRLKYWFSQGLRRLVMAASGLRPPFLLTHFGFLFLSHYAYFCFHFFPVRERRSPQHRFLSGTFN